MQTRAHGRVAGFAHVRRVIRGIHVTAAGAMTVLREYGCNAYSNCQRNHQ
jgi:phage baseplate assembly protein W